MSVLKSTVGGYSVAVPDDVSLAWVNLDYLRVTSVRGANLSNLAMAAIETFYPGEVLKRSQFGFSTPSCKYTSNRQAKMVDISGDQTGDVMAWILEFETSLEEETSRFTRVDYTLDLRLPEKQRGMVSDWYNNGLGQKCYQNRAKARPGETLYFGSRVSPIMGRIYDKSARYDSPLGSVWRFEIEAKRVKARTFASAWAKADDKAVHIGRVVSHHFGTWGVKLPIAGLKLTSEVIAKTDNATIQWIRHSVAPCIARLIGAGRGDEVRAALGLAVENMYQGELL